MNTGAFYQLLQESRTPGTQQYPDQRRRGRSPAIQTAESSRGSNQLAAQKLFATKSPRGVSEAKPVTIYRSPLYSSHSDRTDRSFSASRDYAVSQRHQASPCVYSRAQQANEDSRGYARDGQLYDISSSLVDQIARLELENRFVASDAYKSVPQPLRDVSQDKRNAATFSAQQRDSANLHNDTLTADRNVIVGAQSLVDSHQTVSAVHETAVNANCMRTSQQATGTASVRQKSPEAYHQRAVTQKPHGASRSLSSQRETAGKSQQPVLDNVKAERARTPLEAFQQVYREKQQKKAQMAQVPTQLSAAEDPYQQPPDSTLRLDQQAQPATKKKPIKPTRSSRSKVIGEQCAVPIIDNRTQVSHTEKVDTNATLRRAQVKKNAHYDIDAYQKPVYERLANPAHFTGHYREIYRNQQKDVTNALQLQDTLRPEFRAASKRSRAPSATRPASAPKPAKFGHYQPCSLDSTRVTPKTTHYDAHGQKMSVFDRLSSPKYFTGTYKQIYRTTKEQQNERQQMLRADLSQFVRPWLNDEKHDTSAYKSRSAFERSRSTSSSRYAHPEPPVYEKLTNKDLYTGTAFNTANGGRFCRDYAGDTFLPKSFRNMTNEQRAFFEYMNYINRDQMCRHD